MQDLRIETKSRKTSRSPVKQDAVSAQILREIVEGRLRPGDRFPTRPELERKFGVSTITVQRAMDRLTEFGFIASLGRRGTFVAPRPPHLYRYGIVVPGNSTPEWPWPRFWKAVFSEAERLNGEFGERRIFTYHHGGGYSDSEDFQQLARVVDMHALAGVLFLSDPTPLVGTSVMTSRSLCRVGIGQHEGVDNLDLTIILDDRAFLEMAIRQLLERGCRRVAFVTSGTNYVSRDDRDFVRQQLAAGGALQPDFWYQGLDGRYPQWAREYVQLLLSLPREQRPDGLVIANDNLVEYASQGVASSDARPGEDLHVVGHCNFPWLAPSGIPMSRLGFDTGRILDAAVNAINNAKKPGTRRHAATLTVSPRLEVDHR
jgi:DNA-binding LacI/PurR family transcriptional regulator